jgi:hypothetical protein
MKSLKINDEMYGAAFILVYLVLSAIWCANFFPLLRPNTSVMLDGDPALNAWALKWVSRALTHDWINLFNGNTFYPHPNSIALSEHMAGLAIFNVPVQWFTDNPWVGYNLLIFSAYFFSAIGGYLFILYLTKNKIVAFWAGIFWAFGFFRIHHIGHLQILSYQWFPFVALFLLKTIEDPSIKNTLLLSVFFIFQALTSWYLAVIVSVLIMILFIANMTRTNWNKKHALAFGSAAILIGSAIMPFVSAYNKVIKESTLTDRMASINGIGDQVKLADYLTPPIATFLGSYIPNNKYWIWQENTLFIGYTACILAMAGVLYAYRKNKHMFFAAIALLLIGFVFALGYVSPALNVKLPLYYLANIFPFMAAIRATQRYSLLIYFGVLILSGYGLAGLINHLSKRNAILLTLAVSTSYLIETYPYNLGFGEIAQYAPSALDREIAKIKLETSEQLTIVHYPIYTAMPGYPTQESVYMLDSTLHWANIMNGFSGAEPKGFHDDMQILNRLPNIESLNLLQRNNVNVLAIHKTVPEQRRKEIKQFFEETKLGDVTHVGTDEYLVRLSRP